jgi:hypothetical protein
MTERNEKRNRSQEYDENVVLRDVLGMTPSKKRGVNQKEHGYYGI